jgi:hypothetical protein
MAWREVAGWLDVLDGIAVDWISGGALVWHEDAPGDKAVLGVEVDGVGVRPSFDQARGCTRLHTVYGPKTMAEDLRRIRRESQGKLPPLIDDLQNALEDQSVHDLHWMAQQMDETGLMMVVGISEDELRLWEPKSARRCRIAEELDERGRPAWKVTADHGLMPMVMYVPKKTVELVSRVPGAMRGWVKDLMPLMAHDREQVA